MKDRQPGNGRELHEFDAIVQMCLDIAAHATHGGRRQATARLRALADGLAAMGKAGLPVKSIAPQGAIYVSAQFDLRGRKTPDGQPLDTNDAIRRYLLDAAGLGAVPFQAFGLPGDTGWFRLSIGVVSVADIEALLPRIQVAVESTT